MSEQVRHELIFKEGEMKMKARETETILARHLFFQTRKIGSDQNESDPPSFRNLLDFEAEEVHRRVSNMVVTSGTKDVVLG